LGNSGYGIYDTQFYGGLSIKKRNRKGKKNKSIKKRKIKRIKK